MYFLVTAISYGHGADSLYPVGWFTLDFRKNFPGKGQKALTMGFCKE